MIKSDALMVYMIFHFLFYIACFNTCPYSFEKINNY